ncbi:hypothetical protein C8J57DRAFT_1122620, partial [Mycena rebaudengoi]
MPILLEPTPTLPSAQNSILNPIVARLPVELLSEIFILCLPNSSKRYPNPRTVPLILLRICTAWANIARSTPALWDTIHVEFPRAEGFEHLFDYYLVRSQSRGLPLTLTGQFDEDSSALLWAHAHRMQPQPGSATTMLPAASMNLKALKVFPDINNLDLMGVLRMMHAAPGLVECTLIYGCLDAAHADLLTLPYLQSLSMGEYPFCSDLHILEYLSVPALRTLSILSFNFDEVVLISFLKRLEAPLQSLNLDLSYTKVTPEFHTQLLNLVPTLTCLSLSWLNASDSTLFLNLVGGSPQGCLPQLRDLTVFVMHFHELDFDPLRKFLSARRS